MARTLDGEVLGPLQLVTLRNQTVALLTLAGASGATAALLDILDVNAAHVFRATADSKLGFYTAAPIVQQTGVAVSAAGVHAAGVALGLWTA